MERFHGAKETGALYPAEDGQSQVVQY